MVRECKIYFDFLLLPPGNHILTSKRWKFKFDLAFMYFKIYGYLNFGAREPKNGIGFLCRHPGGLGGQNWNLTYVASCISKYTIIRSWNPKMGFYILSSQRSFLTFMMISISYLHFHKTYNITIFAGDKNSKLLEIWYCINKIHYIYFAVWKKTDQVYMDNIFYIFWKWKAGLHFSIYSEYLGKKIYESIY